MRHHRYLLACLLPLLVPVSVIADKSTQQHLADGNQFLSTGRFNDALSSFDAAIQMDPENYLSYYKRATAYLSLGRNHAALHDFTKILDLKPDFEQALLQRVRIYVKQGEFKLAKEDLNKLLKANSQNAEAATLLAAVTNSENALEQAARAEERGELDECIQLAVTVISTAPQMIRPLLIRSRCNIAKGDIEDATGDLTRVAHLNPGDADSLIQLASINYFSLNEPDTALSHIRQCLHYDPEHKQCKKMFRQIKKLNKEISKVEGDFQDKKYATAANNLVGTATRKGIIPEIDESFAALEQALHAENKMPKRLHLKCYELACRIYGDQKQKDSEKIDKWCSATLDLQDDNAEALLLRGEVRLQDNDFEGAVRDLEKANTATEGQNHRVRQLLQRAKQLLRQSKQRNYYKILGVSRDADTREIKRAYRKLAQEWHPDRYTGDLSKEEVEQKMAEINQANEVLSNEDLRQQYDNGIDPFDPENGQNGGGHPFQHGQHPFAHFQGGFPFGGGGGGGFPGGGPFSFKMHF